MPTIPGIKIREIRYLGRWLIDSAPLFEVLDTSWIIWIIEWKMLIGQEEIQKKDGITSEGVPGTYNYIDRLNRYIEKIWSKSWLRAGGNKTRIKQY